MESHYVIIPPEKPVDGPTYHHLQNQSAIGRKKIFPVERRSVLPLFDFSSGSLSSISHPLSALPLQFQVDPEDDYYTRETKEQAAWEAAAVMEAEVASTSRGSSAMDLLHQSAKRPRSLTKDSPGRERKISVQASGLVTPALLLLTNGDPEMMQ